MRQGWLHQYSNKRLIKYVYVKIKDKDVVHICKVSSVDVCFCKYSAVFNEVIEQVNTLTAAIVTGRMMQ